MAGAWFAGEADQDKAALTPGAVGSGLLGMHRLRLAAPTPEHAQRGKAFTVKLQLAKENGAVPLPPGAAPGGCPVRIELRTADLTPLGGESILAVEPVGAKRLALAADGSCAARVTVLQGCNKVHYGPGHTTECFHTITCPLFLYCEATLPLAAALRQRWPAAAAAASSASSARTVVGIEWSEAMVEAARRNASVNGAQGGRT